MRVERQRFKANLAGNRLDIENVEMQGVGIDAACFDRFQRIRMGKDVCGDRLAAPDQSLAGEILLQFGRLGRQCLRDAADAAVLQWRKAAEMQFAFFAIALADALVLNRQQQAVVFGNLQFFEQ